MRRSSQQKPPRCARFFGPYSIRTNVREWRIISYGIVVFIFFL